MLWVSANGQAAGMPAARLRQIEPAVAIDVAPRVAVIVARERAIMVARGAAHDKHFEKASRAAWPA